MRKGFIKNINVMRKALKLSQLEFLKKLNEMHSIDVIKLTNMDRLLITDIIKEKTYWEADNHKLNRLRKRWYGERDSSNANKYF